MIYIYIYKYTYITCIYIYLYIHIYVYIIYIFKHLIGDYGQTFAQDGFALYVWQPPGCSSGVT